MADIRGGNWSFREPGDDVPDGSVIYGGNFSQSQPDTVILEGKTLTIRGGNWTNVKRDPAWVIEGGGFGNVEFCANLHPELVERGVLEAEVEECPHVVDTDEVVVDGEVVSTVYYYRDTK